MNSFMDQWINRQMEWWLGWVEAW